MISIVLPYYSGDVKRWEILLKFKECFKNQTLGRDQYEIISIEDEESLKNISDIHIKLKRTPRFNKAWHINCGIRRAKFDWILMIDCDMIFSSDYLEKVVGYIKANPDNLFFLAFDKMVRETGDCLPHGYTIEAKKHDCAGGAFVVNKNFWWLIGGANENYQGHGAEDGDIFERVQWERLKKRQERTIPILEGMKLIHQYHKFEKPSFGRLKTICATIDHTEVVIDRLRKANLGNIEHETLITLDDLPINRDKFRERYANDQSFLQEFE